MGHLLSASLPVHAPCISVILQCILHFFLRLIIPTNAFHLLLFLSPFCPIVAFNNASGVSVSDYPCQAQLKRLAKSSHILVPKQEAGVLILHSRKLHSCNFAPTTSLRPLHSRTTSLPDNFAPDNFTPATSLPHNFAPVQLHSRNFTPEQLHSRYNFTSAQVHSRYNFVWNCREWSCRSGVVGSEVVRERSCAGVKLSGVKLSGSEVVRELTCGSELVRSELAGVKCRWTTFTKARDWLRGFDKNSQTHLRDIDATIAATRYGTPLVN